MPHVAHVAHLVYSNSMLHAIIQRNTFTASAAAAVCLCLCLCCSLCRRMMPIAASGRKRRSVRRVGRLTHTRTLYLSLSFSLAHSTVQLLLYFNLIETFLNAARRQPIEVSAVAAIDLPAAATTSTSISIAISTSTSIPIPIPIAIAIALCDLRSATLSPCCVASRLSLDTLTDAVTSSLPPCLLLPSPPLSLPPCPSPC